MNTCSLRAGGVPDITASLSPVCSLRGVPLVLLVEEVHWRGPSDYMHWQRQACICSPGGVLLHIFALLFIPVDNSGNNADDEQKEDDDDGARL